MHESKLVFIHLLNDYSGSPKVLSQVIKAVKKNGIDIELFTGRSNDGFLSYLTNKHYYYFYKRFENKYLTLVTYSLSQISLFFHLLKYRNQDVIFYINTLLPFGAALAGLVTGKTIYYHVHETSLRPLIMKQFLRFIVQKSASKVIFVSESVLKSEFFLNMKQSVVYNALADDYVQLIEDNNYQWKQENCFTVLMVCSLKAYKGVNEFIEIAHRCSHKKDVLFTLILNAEQLEIDHYFSEIKLPSNITLISRQTNLVSFYKQVSLVLNLSRIDECVETFGLTIIEAMAFGIPVIVPPVGGPTEIVADGIEGFLMSSYDTEKITHKILELSDDEAKCLELSKYAKKRSGDFMPKAFEENILSVISE